MDSWQKLFEEVTAHERAREQAARDAEKVMGEMAAQARNRSAQLREHTGRRVEVEFPASGPRGKDPQGPYLTFMRLSGEQRELEVYFHRDAEGVCALHFVRVGAAESVGRKRVASQLGCFIAPGARELRDRAGTTVTVDELVLKSFRLLLTARG